ncbi:reverse transcriptase domain-containing protein [Tanacetum coccineum]|uniref:Reverse transcriptase domain-containing protein n=1 Tax=Tanacetum coccineum TaxID=301880 RepID=A0ABQ4YWY3_9ASTR
MTKQGNFTQRTPQAKKQSDQASRQISKQASGSANTPYDLVFTAMGPPPETTATITSTEETLVALMQEGNKKETSKEACRPDLTTVRRTIYPPRHPKGKTRKENRRPQYSVIERKFQAWAVDEKSTACLDKGLPSESPPPGSVLRTVRRKRRRRVSSSSEDSSDNEDAETGHWKSKNKYREDEDMSRPWRRQKVDAFTRRISDFSEDKKRRMPANVKTYDGTGDPDDHLKIFESAATIENWPQPVWCHMFNSTLVGNARNWFSKLPRRSIDGFEELRRAFRLNFTQRKKCAKNPVELARVKQRQGESTSAYVERYKDECIHVKACPEILKISGFMNGINNPELIKRLNDRVPQTFDELMKRTSPFQSLKKPPPRTTEKLLQTTGSQEQSRRQSNDQSSSRNNSYRGQRGGRGNDKYTPLTMTPKEILATEGSNFPKPPPMRTPEEQRVGNGYCEYHRQKGHTTNECVQLRQLIDKLVKEGRLDHLVKNIKEGKDKQRSGGKKDAPRDKADTIYMVQSWQRKTKQKVSQKFSHGSGISFPTLTADNAVVEPLTIEINAAGHDIHRMYIDGGASADILYEHCFQRLRPEVKSQLNPATTSLTGFTGEKIWPMGQLRLPVMVGNKEHSTTAWMNFMVIRSPSPYNGIIGRPGISAIRAVPSTAHGMLKFPVDGGIVTIYNTAAPPKECNTVTCDVTQTQRQHATKVTNLKVAIHPDYPEQEVSIGGSLSDTGRAAVCALLQRNLDIFAWEPKHMTGVPRSITEHKLKIRQGYSPVRQKKRGQAPERAKAILELWSKRAMTGKWSPYADTPSSASWTHTRGITKSKNNKGREEKTAFHTSQGVYCYTKMPFGLKNAGATYQRLVDNAFEGQVGRNLEVYVDDLVIKSHTEDELVRDIVETFRALRKINMKLNPKKCTFGATEGMFLGYLIEPDGIRPCPEKTKAVIQLPSPRTLKEVQSLNGKLAGLNRFLSKSADKSLPLFKTLKKCTKKGDFRWTTAAEEAFTQLKQHIAALPTLVAPRPGEELIMYLSATHGAISAVLLTDRDSVQTPVYFVSKALKETEINYSAMEKLILALVFAAKRLRRYSDFLIEKPETDAVLPQEAKLQPKNHGSYSRMDRHAWTARMGVRNLEANVDSRLVANHVLGEYVAKEDNMIQYLDKTKSLIQGFDRFTIRQVPRGDNKKADALSKIASTSFAHLSKQVLVEILKNKSIAEMEISTVIEEQDPTWMTPIIEFISKGTLPHEQKDARRIRRTAQRFELRNGVLYRRSFLQPWLRCVGPIQADYVLREIHAGSCSMHSGPRSVVARALRSGYYWPTMHRDARDMIKKCNDCQVHRPIPRQPQQELTPITSPWPFHKWGIDIAGPFPVAAGGLKFLIVAIDYFTKWIEAKAVATITGNQAKESKRAWIDIKAGDIVYRATTQPRGRPGKLGPKWKGPSRLRKHLEKEHTSCVTWRGVSCPARELSAISRNAIFRKCSLGIAVLLC